MKLALTRTCAPAKLLLYTHALPATADRLLFTQPVTGNVSVGAIQTALPFQNTVVIMNLNGSIIQLILENAVSRINPDGTTVGTLLC